ncbi:MAG: UDP-3-O-(3-hydroxymyristoyl)glucosamine N-acyltransferase [Candidatus Xiphinematobacter sp.]|nr:MAG: UDP-3-O-(3-hydroxymyristoyl)glucosamine N-acyltransferase [Candidatus Xiphinematobacter sp.]QQY08177.1 MAG: UDP-3-O-(3-hydroxymyristoyl)glucosamine N-acyltransferase [Candidatus Xiphinematobacter sp.]QQY08923.1 MAG: UDP-3-O-(3-hydroxymyristoyl)glucosamine N-acyltransferase [Candidatus Xiphinematobacter sp.]QQY11138.1 MAG: UDP-3-O-(3-hydroxymyristoyl)glucosamine N-acyltransferase [Candidatus Xiphinematobacter sp.]
MRLGKVAQLVNAEVPLSSAAVEIYGVSAVEDAGSSDVTFLGNLKYLRALRSSRAAAVLVPMNFEGSVPPILLRVENPTTAFGKLIDFFSEPDLAPYTPGIHRLACVAEGACISPGVSIQPFAIVEPGAQIGAETIIGAHCYIGQKVTIGEKCLLYPRVSILARCLVGNRVILHPGVVLGSDGFGFEYLRGEHIKLPQRGIVQVDDDVEIGANTTVDRARFGRTWIQKGVKVDNLVQIAHNATVGECSILCGQAGIAGSARIGRRVTIAGQAGINGHIEIGDGAIIAAKSGVVKSASPKEVLIGVPARPIRAYKRRLFHVERLEKLYARVRRLEEVIIKLLQ